MSDTFDDTNRQMLPRWYPFDTARRLGGLEAEPTRGRPLLASSGDFRDKVAAWRLVRSIPHALEVAGSALVAGDLADPDAREAADFVRASMPAAGSLGGQIANAVLYGFIPGPTLSAGPPPNEPLHSESIARLKKMVRGYPGNAIAWADLSYRYAALGQLEKSLRAMEVAISLNGDNRFVLRCAARCFLHLGQPDRSLYHLRHSRSSAHDPWLASAEIAIAEGTGRQGTLTRAGQQMIGSGQLSPWALNELAATLGTLEARHGSIKKAKSLVLAALLSPNENTVAQAEWLAIALRQQVLRPSENIPATFEADARRSLRDGHYRRALAHAKEWFRFQPFASRPAILASYIASVCLQDDEEAAAIAREGRRTSPGSFLLKNNLAFSLASTDHVTAAVAIVNSITPTELRDRERSTLTATRGLLEFRSGNIAEGRRLYLKAITDLRRTREHRGAASALLFLAREELRVGSGSATAMLQEARAAAASHDAKELVAYADTLAR